MAALHHDTSPATDIKKYRPDLNPQLAQLLMQSMEPNPANRIQDMETFVNQLKKVSKETV